MSREFESDLGFSRGLPTYDNLCESSHGQKRSYFVLRPTTAVTDWNLYSGNAYVAQFSKEYRRLLRDVYGVNVPGRAPLVRVETLALCLSTSDSYYFDPVEEFSYDAFRWNSSYWRTTATTDYGYWGQFTKLYVNLGGTVPSTTAVIAELGFFASQEGEVHPTMGPDLLGSKGLMENALVDWGMSESDAGGQWAFTADTSDYQDGTQSMKLAATAATSGWLAVYITTAAPLIVGKRYRFAGSYRYDGPGSGSVTATTSIGSGSTYIGDDGRSTIASGNQTFQPTNGSWRRFCWDFIANNASAYYYFALVYGSGTVTCSILLDKVTLRRVHRLDTFESRVGPGDVPNSATGSPSIFFSGKSVGVGGLTLRNADGALDYALGQLTWIGRKVEHWIGGEVPGVGKLDRDEWQQRFTGIIQSVDFNDAEVSFGLEDFRTKFHKTLPPNFLSTIDANIEPGARGAAKPMLFGGKNGIKPWRTAYDTVYSRFGSYLVADVTNWSSGIYSIDNVYAYLDQDAADQIDTARRISLKLPQVEREPSAIYKGIASTSASSSYQTTYTKDATSSWTDNMIASRPLLHGDGYIEFQAGGVTNAEVIVGLSVADASALNYTDINFALYLNGAASFQAMELGSGVGSSHAYTGSYRFRVRRTGTTIAYQYNILGDGVLWATLYTSALSSTGPLQLKASIYAASKALYAVSLYGFGEVSTTVATGSFMVREDVGPFEVTLSNQTLNFDIGASELTATIPVGLYTANGLAKEITYRMKIVAGGAVCSYSQSTGLFTISAPSGTLNLKIQDGKNKEVGIWGLIGFGRSANRTGSLSYAGENSVWDVASIDSNHLIRCDARGYIDDGSGTYTGVAGALIQRGCDIARALIRGWLAQPVTTIDSASFLSARTTAPESLAFYLQEPTSSTEIFERLEASNLANIVVGGDGVVRYIVYSYTNETVPAARRIEERDLIERPQFSKLAEEVHSGVTILYDQRPDSGVWKAANAANASEAANYDAIVPKEIETYVRLSDTADTLAARVLVLAQRPPTRVRILTGAKLFRANVGDIVSLTRKRALNATGTSDARPYRVLSIEPNAIEGRVAAELVEASALPAGQNCISSCQYLCEQSVQNECAVVSQTGCATSCQEACQISCQVCGQGANCQTTCETTSQALCSLTCQTCGQSANCQTACESAAQGGGGCTGTCQVACQTCGEAASCQSTCEAACQACGQSASCQSTCETACQACAQAANCQEACQTTCQFCQQAANCQTTCQSGGCESTCEFASQDTCQITCQSASESPLSA